MSKDVSWLVNTSVDDMRSSLECAEANNNEYLDIKQLREALEIVTRRGEKTKVKILQRYIRKFEKESV